ncbi:MAG TPA: hydroxymethylbilane synthase [Steroidobacteraceae bacterium]|nr:hydroxymethylbilane synthase [Steroidobacteraceae bacterium]
MPMGELRLGTRRSALAWAQSLWVAEHIQRLNPGTQVRLIPIETRGDRITDLPLSQVEGKEFFSAEIDAALLAGDVDLTVHSLKDLSLERPAQLTLAAIPKRENPRDVIIFRADVRQRLRSGQVLRIGTSAPRRLENVPRFIARALPGDGLARVECVEIRGNVDTRLGRLHEPEASERRLDGVVLAFAGLIRLWRDTRPEGGREKLRALLQNIRWMVLPLTDCPTAPGQGALAVECRSNAADVRTALARLNDETSARLAAVERQVLAQYGGGCHQRFGATCIEHPAFGSLLYLRGVGPGAEPLDRVTWLGMPQPPRPPTHWWDGFSARESNDVPAADISYAVDAAFRDSSAPVFVAHSRALPSHAAARLSTHRVWTSGTASWFRMARLGVWVEGCAEGLGYESIAPTLGEPVLGLPPLDKWQILSHAAAADHWPGGEVIGTYRLPEVGTQTIPDAASLTHVYWASGSQFRELWSRLPASVHHACGPGKTAHLIRAAGISNLTVFPSVHEWRRWLQIEPPTQATD